MALQLFLLIHSKKNDTLRLGQRFVNMYMKYSWPELFYEKDYGVSTNMIKTWLDEHHYFNELPVEIKR